MKKIGVLTIHGMGTQKKDFDADLRKRLKSRLEDEVVEHIEFQGLFYQGVIKDNQKNTWNRLVKNTLTWKPLRKFMLFYFSDATTYQYKPREKDSVYLAVHKALKENIDKLKQRLNNEQAPIIIIANSLGCHVISNYIWDAQDSMKNKEKGLWVEGKEPNNFDSLGTTAYMFTTGCNIPLFVSGLEIIKAIAKPNKDFKWINFYANPDALGWPLKPLSKGFENSYDEVVDEDVLVWQGFTPLAHTRYWKSSKVLDPIADAIREVHAALP